MYGYLLSGICHDLHTVLALYCISSILVATKYHLTSLSVLEWLCNIYIFKACMYNI